MCYLNCRRCGLTLEVRGREGLLDRCPRCARRGRTVTMSRGATGELKLEGSEAGSGRHVLSLVGEIDVDSSAHLEARVLQLCADGAAGVTLDVTELSFIDSRGLLAVMLSMKRCKSCGCDFAMINGQSPVRGLSELTSLGTLSAPIPIPIPVAVPIGVEGG